ncbi:MAG: NAD(P)H-dependent oxidoreductase [Maritimibacter sp.]
MKLLAISGSLRAASTNRAFLRAIAGMAPDGVEIELYQGLGTLPVFSPDLEDDLPESAQAFSAEIAACDGLIISSPEYIRAIPGGLKNGIDWLVSGEALIDKPVALAHASHRGEDVLESLRRVLATVTTRFAEDIFLRVPLMQQTPDEIAATMATPERQAEAQAFLSAFAGFCAAPVEN